MVVGRCHGFRRDFVRVQGVCMVDREKFVKDALMRQEIKRCREKEEYAIAMINLENVYESYMHNKKYNHGKKCTKFQYQC